MRIHKHTHIHRHTHHIHTHMHTHSMSMTPRQQRPLLPSEPPDLGVAEAHAIGRLAAPRLPRPRPLQPMLLRRVALAGRVGRRRLGGHRGVVVVVLLRRGAFGVGRRGGAHLCREIHSRYTHTHTHTHTHTPHACACEFSY